MIRAQLCAVERSVKFILVVFFKLTTVAAIKTFVCLSPDLCAEMFYSY